VTDDNPLVWRVLDAVDPIPLLPRRFHEPVARTVWFLFAPAYLLGMLCLAAGEAIRAVSSRVATIPAYLGMILATPCFYLYETYWAP
jgi:hypothetical protein